jgi:murein tripeptide amidase MpaA
MEEYIRADNDFWQRREEAYRYSEMTRGFGGRLHTRHVRTIHNPNSSDYYTSGVYILLDNEYGFKHVISVDKTDAKF